jgi:hypothetical protein
MKEIELGGKSRPINFGIGALAQYCGERKIPLTAMESAFAEMNLLDMIDLMYHALVAGCRRARVDVDFEREDITDWLEEDGALAVAMEAFAASQSMPDTSKPSDKKNVKTQPARKTR